MRSVNWGAVIVAAAFLSETSAAQGWFEYSNQQDRFSINLPGEPSVDDTTYMSEFSATYPARVHSVASDGNSYSVTVVDFTDAQRIHAEMEKYEAAIAPNQWINDQLASIARAAREFRERGGEVTFDAWSHIDMVQGHQLQITNDDRSRTFVGIYMNGHTSRLYVLEATVGERSPPPMQFQQSLRFLDEQGESIRYNLLPNGCSVDPA